MKELTRIVTVEITHIAKANDNDLVDIVEDDKDTSAFENMLKGYLQADDVRVSDVRVSNIQNFVIDKIAQ